MYQNRISSFYQNEQTATQQWSPETIEPPQQPTNPQPQIPMGFIPIPFPMFPQAFLNQPAALVELYREAYQMARREALERQIKRWKARWN